MTDVAPRFLKLAEVLAIHRDGLARFGGAEGVRDFGLLESAIAQPKMSFGGQFLHRDLFAMAAAYAFHIAANHPFLDGNKRAGLASALVFLELNGIELDDGELYDAMIGVAEGRLAKSDFADVLRQAQDDLPEGGAAGKGNPFPALTSRSPRDPT